MTNSRNGVLVGMIFLAALSRLVPHPPNITAIAAMALFSGAYLDNRRLALLVPLAALCLSDLFLGFYPGMPFVYGSFMLIVGIGFLLRTRKRFLPIASAALGSSLLFFLITNAGEWAFGILYPKTLAGLVQCFIAAIPFFRNMLIGDAFYVTLLFGSFALGQKRVLALAKVHNS